MSLYLCHRPFIRSELQNTSWIPTKLTEYHGKTPSSRIKNTFVHLGPISVSGKLLNHNTFSVRSGTDYRSGFSVTALAVTRELFPAGLQSFSPERNEVSDQSSLFQNRRNTVNNREPKIWTALLALDERKAYFDILTFFWSSLVIS